MAQDTNTVVITGRLTRDVEPRTLQSGTTVTDLRVAFTDREKRGDQWEDRSNYVDVTLWGHDGLLQYLTKGRQLVITGRLRFEEWEKDGERRNALKVVAHHVQLIGGGQQDGGGRSNDIPAAAPASSRAGGGEPYGQDDLPFSVAI